MLFTQSNAFATLPGPSEVHETFAATDITWGPWEHNRAFIVPTLLDGASRDEGSDPPGFCVLVC